jgi:hypothetical protein
MRIKNSFSIFFQLILISCLTYGIVKVLALTQVKKEFSSLEFIPDNATFVGRIDIKEIGIEILKEFINSEGFGKLPDKKKDKQLMDISFVDLDYPLYFFIQTINNKQIPIAVIQISNQNKFLKNVNTSNDNSFGFIHANKGFWVFNCPKKELENIKQSIIKAKSSKWEKLRSSKHELAFMESRFDLFGYVDIDQNLLSIKATSNTIFLPFENYKKLKTNGFNISLSNPLSLVKNLGMNYPTLIDSTLLGVNAISINHQGYSSPFFPNLSVLLQVDSGFNLPQKIKKINSTQIEFENDKLFIAGAKFYISKPQEDCYLLSFKKNQTCIIENSSNPIESNGDLSTLINFEDAPLMKMVLLTNSTFSNMHSLIQKTDKYDLVISQSAVNNSLTLDFKLGLKKNYTLYGEMLNLFML